MQTPERKFQLFDSVECGLVVVDDAFRTLFINGEAARLLGLVAEAVEGVDLRAFLPGLAASLDSVDFPPVALPGDKKILLKSRPLSAENDGLRVISMVDLTELECLRLELKEKSENMKELEAVFNSSFDEIFVTDGQGKVLRVNKAGETLYAIKVEEMIGKNVAELVEEGFFNPSITLKVLEERKRVTSVQTTKHNKKLIATGNPIFDESGNIIRVVTNTRDITEFTNLKQKLEDTEQLIETYRNMIHELRGNLFETSGFVVSSPTMEKIMEMVDRIADVESTVLIEGESGVGKSFVAKKIHDLSNRSDKPFVVVYCGSIPENLLESELFGYETGAFTGARKGGKPGLIELAHGGTVFFDEIGDIPLNLQVKLLQVIQERKFLRVGGQREVEVDIRILAATNRDLRKGLGEKTFREDLYYRLSVVPLVIPPLRHRAEEIPELAWNFLKKFNAKYRFRKTLVPEAIEILKSYHWPGNIRELENLIERLVVTTSADQITVGQLPDYLKTMRIDDDSQVSLDEVFDLKKATNDFERKLLEKAVEKYRNTYRIAAALKLNQSTVVRKLHRHGLSGRTEKPEAMEPGNRINRQEAISDVTRK